MNLLKANHNDHPDWYADYPVDILSLSITRWDDEMVNKVRDDIKERGLVHPIVVRSPYKEYQTEPNPDVSQFNDEERKKVFNVYIGNKRVMAAKQLGFTHISAYHVKRDEDARMLCGSTQIRGFLTNW
jgi:hypothetical protein